MPDQDPDPEKDLQLLGKRVRIGWMNLYPIIPEELEAIRQEVRTQWAMHHPQESAKASVQKAQDEQELQSEQGKARQGEAAAEQENTQARSDVQNRENEAETQRQKDSREETLQGKPEAIREKGHEEQRDEDQDQDYEEGHSH